MFACLGVHPHEAGAPGDLSELRALLEHPKAVAVGETGLDYFRDYAPHDAQQQVFEAQLALALELGKPVVIHTRAADDDTSARLVGHRGHGDPPLLLVAALLEAALANDWYVSFAGNVTYKNAYDLRDCARHVPADRLLVETDSPYLAPQPFADAGTSPRSSSTPTTSCPSCGRRRRRTPHANATRAFGLAP